MKDALFYLSPLFHSACICECPDRMEFSWLGA